MASDPGSAGPSNVILPSAATGAAAETAHLRWVIEKQPSCLMRVGADGTLLAVSDAALSLLGARELAQVLDTNLTKRLPGEAAGLWADFAARVSSSGSGSAECEMLDLSGTRRSVTLLGVASPNHPDGVESLLVTVRDVSAARRLETSLQEQEDQRRSIEELTRKLAAARADLEAAATDRRQLGASLAEANAARDELQKALAASAAQRRQVDNATTDGQQFRAALAEARTRADGLQTALDEARERETRRQRMFSELVNGRIKAEEKLAETRKQLERATTALAAAMEAASSTRPTVAKDVEE